jgi:hypothetical protein
LRPDCAALKAAAVCQDLGANLSDRNKDLGVAPSRLSARQP